MIASAKCQTPHNQSAQRLDICVGVEAYISRAHTHTHAHAHAHHTQSDHRLNTCVCVEAIQASVFLGFAKMRCAVSMQGMIGAGSR